MQSAGLERAPAAADNRSVSDLLPFTQSLPKAELHAQLNGCVRDETLRCEHLELTSCVRVELSSAYSKECSG